MGKTALLKHYTFRACVHPAVQAMFDWCEYSVRDECDAWELDHSGWTLPVENLSAKIHELLDSGAFEWDEQVRFTRMATDAMRNILEYAQHESADWCYTKEEMLAAFDELADFLYFMKHDSHNGQMD